MAIKLTSTKATASHVKCLVYGEAGMGKTVLAGTAPSPLIISAESGLMSLADFDIPVIECLSKADVDEAYHYAIESDHETICLDSVSEIAEVVLAGEKKSHKDGRKAYGVMNDLMIPLIRNFRDIKGKNIYFTAKQIRLVDEANGITSYAPSLPGKYLNNNIEYFFDLVMCLRIGEDEEGEKYRYLMTQPDLYYQAKDRSGKLNEVEQPNLTDIFKKITG